MCFYQAKTIKDNFAGNQQIKRKSDLTAIIREAEQEVAAKQDAWGPLAQEKLNLLEILLELTHTINKKLFNVTIDKVSIINSEEAERGVQVEGVFKSKIDENHFQEFEKFEKFLEQSIKKLTFKERPDQFLGEAGGVKFTLNMAFK